jgi:membrane-bound lytic murein transglycosylase B
MHFVNCLQLSIFNTFAPARFIAVIAAGLLTASAAVVLTTWPTSSALAAKPSASTQSNAYKHYGDREDVDRFIASMVEKHQFIDSELKEMFSKARYLDYVPRLMNPAPAGFKRSWAVYRSRFTDALRVREGVKFWRSNAKAIADASERFGVPEEIIVGIIGVETIYGRMTGDVRVIDALSTLAFDYPRRAEFFRGELENYLLFTRENKFDVFEVKGSFAGAIGIPQFMPSSIRTYALDFSGDGVIDLRNDPTDAIGSVAKFLSDHGWVRNAPTHFPINLLKADDQTQSAEVSNLVTAGLTPKFTRVEIEAAGFSVGTEPGRDAHRDTKFALIDLPNGDNPTSYFLGPQNFFVITRYNRSSFYAMAVIELGQIVKAANQK